MLYYKVKPCMAGRTRWREDLSHRVIADGEYKEGELFTVRELSYYRLSIYAFENGFEKVIVSKKRIYWAHGSRYAREELLEGTTCDICYMEDWFDEPED